MTTGRTGIAGGRPPSTPLAGSWISGVSGRRDLCSRTLVDPEGAMHHYRVYFLGSDHRIKRAIDLSCANDEEAVAYVTEHHDDASIEVWQAERPVYSSNPVKQGVSL